MKNKSPAHRLLQLRRKTEKIVLPKASWDLSNKENNNGNDVSRSKNNSSKKSSLDKRHVKKSNSMTQNMLISVTKPIIKETPNLKKPKQIKQIQYNSYYGKKNQSKIDKQNIQKIKKNIKQHFTDISEKAKHNQVAISKLKTEYSQIFGKIKPSTKNEKMLATLMEQHIYLWMNKCEQLKDLVCMMAKDTSKYNGTQNFSQETIQLNNTTESQINLTQSSFCEYIVDPKQETCYRSLKAEQLKDQLHLNLDKAEELRRKEFL